MGFNPGSDATGWRSLAVAIVCVWLAACIGQRPPDAPTAAVGEYPTRELTLPSGLQVVMEQSADFGVAGAVLVVGTGSADEPLGKAGLAHLTEHLVLRSRPEGARSIKQRLSARSTAWNAWTSWDSTTYAVYVPVPSLEAVLGVMSELLAQPLAGVSDGEIALELEIVQNERRLRAENGTQSQSLGWLATAVFPTDFAYAHPVAGTRESLRALVRADVEEFVRASYSPGRATLSVSSPLDFEAQRALIEAAFGALPAKARPAAARPLTAHENVAVPPLSEAGGAPEVREALVASPTLLVGWSAPSSVAEHASVADVLALMASDVFVDNSEQREVASVQVSYLEGVKSNMFYLEATLSGVDTASPEVAGEIVERLAQRLRRGLYERINVAQLFERYKRAAAVRQTYAFEQLGTRVVSLARSKQFLSSSGVLAKRDRQLRALAAETASSYVDKYLGLPRARAVIVRPGAGHAEAAQSRESAAGGAAVSVRDPGVQLAEAEVRSWVRPFRADEISTSTLSNGMALIVLNRPSSVYHSVLVGFAGGATASDVPGVSIAEPWSLIRDELELSVQGLSVARYHSADASVELVRSTGDNLELSMNALRKRLEGITVLWPPRRFLDRVSVFARSDEQPPNQLRRERETALFGDSPYGRVPTSQQVHAVRPNDIYRFRDRVLRPENGVLVIVGNAPPEEARTLAEEVMGGWSKLLERKSPLPPPGPVSPRPAQPWIERDWPGSTQAQVGLSCLLQATNPDEMAVASTLAYLIGSRLFDQLREQLGASYSISDRSRILRGGTAVVEHVADVSYEQLVPALSVVDDFVRSPPLFTDAELEWARRAFAADYNLRYSTTHALAEALFRSWVLGQSAYDFLQQPARLFSVSLARVNGAAQRCAEHAVRSLLGDMQRVAHAQSAARAAP